MFFQDQCLGFISKDWILNACWPFVSWAGMCGFMPLHILQVVELLFTLRATVWLFFHMYLHFMSSQMSCLSKGFLTFFAIEWFITRVCSFMLFHVLWIREFIGTFGAGTWLFFFVIYFMSMSLQLKFFSKFLFAMIAVVKFITLVNFFMLLFAVPSGKSDITIRALEWFIIRVSCFMSLQVTGALKCLATFGTALETSFSERRCNLWSYPRYKLGTTQYFAVCP